jgi:hypothetical protein
MSIGDQTADEIYRMVRQAIIDKDLVVASYQGHVREICPHVIGKKNGRLRAFLYQFAGGSDSGRKPDGSSANWRCLFIDELSDVTIQKSEGTWHTASNYSAMQSCVDEIDARVEIGKINNLR